MPSLDGCDHDPFHDHPTIRGAALVTGHRRWCELMDPGHPDYNPRMREVYIRTTYHLAGMDPPPTPATPESGGRVGRIVIPVAESLRRIALARACESRTAAKCGCAGLATCLLGKGRDGVVSLSECVECVAAFSPGDPPRNL